MRPFSIRYPDHAHRVTLATGSPGPPGPEGPAGPEGPEGPMGPGATFETPVGTIDGSNRTFTMGATLGVVDVVFVDGLTDFQASGDGLTLTVLATPFVDVRILRLTAP